MVPIGDTGAICVKAGGSFGVVVSTNAGVSCLTCKYGKSFCDRVKKVESITSDSHGIDLATSSFKAFLSVKFSYSYI